MHKENEEWDLVVKPQSSLLDLNLKDLWRYKDLLFLFVKRDIVATYKQTILGPVWFVLQPLLTSLTYLFIMGMANGSTEGKPRFLFYLAGITCWGYFAECLTATSNVFVNNASIFGKVYFPRLIVPLSIVMSSLLKFMIQIVFLFVICVIVYFKTGYWEVNSSILILPVLVVLMGLLGLGAGVLISSFTTKYRDLRFFVAFGVQLLMFLSPVILPKSAFTGKGAWIIAANPMTSIIETFKSSILGPGTIDVPALMYTACFTLVLLLIAVVIFNKVEKSFMDTV